MISTPQRARPIALEAFRTMALIAVTLVLILVVFPAVLFAAGSGGLIGN